MPGDRRCSMPRVATLGPTPGTHSASLAIRATAGTRLEVGLNILFSRIGPRNSNTSITTLGMLHFKPALPLVATTFKNDEHTIKLGLNYRFNWAGMGSARGY